VGFQDHEDMLVILYSTLLCSWFESECPRAMADVDSPAE
jgi:hypothetical protein